MEYPRRVIENDGESFKEAGMAQQATTKGFHSIREPSSRCKGDWRICVRGEDLDGDVCEVRVIYSANPSGLICGHLERIEADGETKRERKHAVIRAAVGPQYTIDRLTIGGGEATPEKWSTRDVPIREGSRLGQ